MLTGIKRQAYLASHTGHGSTNGNPISAASEKIHFGGVLGPYQEPVSTGSSDLDVDTCLKINNYEDTVRQLDMYYGLVKRQLLHYQSPTTGLFPAQTVDKEVGSVRDSIYCASAIWSLYQAYRRIDDDRGKSYELGQSAVKCFRGILRCWLQVANKVEAFKKNQVAQNALFTRYHLQTGQVLTKDQDPCMDNHLQLDVVSLYLLFLVQIIQSGLQVIYTMDEVIFIQNLVYYVERAYRTPDFGLWQRGSKYNDGTPEIHASSIGMAKAALEAINGCNLFGEKGSSVSVIYVDIDAHNRNRSIFETLLPRESSSKNTDASLLPTISWPCFATHDDVLYNRTKSKIIRRLKGSFGFKRFLRDGYGTAVEDINRRYYNEGETRDFENIESEWPIFYLYMMIDGFFKGLPEQVEEYKRLLKARVRHDHRGDPVIPKYFYVPQESVDYEKMEPGSQMRHPSDEGGSHNLFLWGQSLYITASLLAEGLVHVNELDLIRRYLPSYNRPRKMGGRYSAFQSKHGTASDLVVQIVLIAESMRLQAMMGTYGIQTQTPHEVEPVQIWPPKELVKVYEHLGLSKRLGLQGRPTRPIGALGTSKIYRISGQTVLCYPLIFEVSDFYLSHDMSLLIDDIKTELHFVGRYWRLSGRPTVCILIREEHMRDPQFKEMLELLAMLKKGHCDGLKVRTGRLQNLISSSCIEHLDFMNQVDLKELNIQPFGQVHHDYIGYQSLTDVPKALQYSEAEFDFTQFNKLNSTAELIDSLRCVEGLHTQAYILGVIQRREHPEFVIDNLTVRERLIHVKRLAGSLRHWSAVRLSSALLFQLVDSISPFITTVLVNGKQLTVGVVGGVEVVLDKPMTPSEIHEAIYRHCPVDDPVQAVLQQEVLLYCGRLIATHPNYFSGILKIRVGWILHAIRLYLAVPTDTDEDCNHEPLESRSPSEIRRLLLRVLHLKNLTADDNQFGLQLTPYKRRQIEGCLARVPEGFYQKVWNVLKKTPGGIVVQGHMLAQEPTLSHMTMSELNFSLLVEDMLFKIVRPEYRQLVVELLCIVNTILLRNPELRFKMKLDLDFVISEALAMFLKDFGTEIDTKISSNDGTHKKSSIDPGLTQFYNATAATTNGYLARAVVNTVLRGDLGTECIDDSEESCRVS
ncbi:probable phosphorylase b kinase regulatory subunit beta isoform X2 [Daphnia pulicaria]|uniref:probable phosphorylase b kinase regulatory subunit beta isoform X2 n=1 Tax=Daphnia pulicaria TaxID=35523 RepID=UPI001EEC4E82|nr:probable phosphorylase b kinase regulatory subunit beta isoform X2 [Daphnia pulicaria]